MEIRAFRGWRYRTLPGGDVSAYLAPPYDVLSEWDKQALLKQNRHNIVSIDLPHVPPADPGPEELYRQAAGRLAEWKSAGVLVQEQRPAIYAYEQSFLWAGRRYTRRAMLCGVRADQPGRQIIPHERIFPGVKADRLKLTQHTQMQLSPIFGFFNDPQGQAMDLLFASIGPAESHGRLGNVEQRLWPVTSEGVIREIASILRDVPVFIADGHHRYATALSYSQELSGRSQAHRDHEANFAFFSLVARDDPGLLVLPTHRIIRGMKSNFRVGALKERCPQFTWQRCSVQEADLGEGTAFLRRYGRGAMAFIEREPAEIWIGKLSDPSAMEEAAPDQLPAWRELDVAVLHKLVIDKAIEPWRTEGLFIEYTPEAHTVLAACNSGRAQLGICLQPTPLEAVEAVALAGEVMPHKSTYFYPKPATGTVLKPLQ